jgi:hypothetical protein
MSGRVAQDLVEALIQEEVRAVVTSYALEALITHPTASPTTVTGAGVTQYRLEVLMQEGVGVHATQYALEVLMADGNSVPPPPGGGGGTHIYGHAA